MILEQFLKNRDPQSLLRKMISIPSFSGLEGDRCLFLYEFIRNLFINYNVNLIRIGNNLVLDYVVNKNFRTLMLNSHIDTVKPVNGYTFDPFNPNFNDSIIRGLGSNDAGASVVSMVYAMLFLVESNFKSFNIRLILSAEEETSGKNGIDTAIKAVGEADAAIVGEPTEMKAAIAERGLLVLDCLAKGKSGHAARGDGVYAIYIALDDIAYLRDLQLESLYNGSIPVNISVNIINAGVAHNVTPDECKFVVDIRTTGEVTNSHIFNILTQKLKSQIYPRNLDNKASFTPSDHPLLSALRRCSIDTFVSSTTSDWMRLNIPAIKMGPGESIRSHSADEFVTVDELYDAIKIYVKYIKELTI